ncbi:hypothetical protein D0T53_06760 [Dysgonomonas sp. 216]|uniref:LA_2272 family surface repeat-containing protein n=1 Tax=Dysgonomonas sp. 216 TaxID=2302934 RepID=UPI0013D0C313|nr:hypothetical protein [Dysgonomonas sp. 216]NDW18615.1 hypothetical protein [Dysgonomonas sp. 216]
MKEFIVTCILILLFFNKSYSQEDTKHTSLFLSHPALYKKLELDTLKINKKNKYVLWSYYDNHTRINGVSVGVGQINAKNVTNNGVKFEVPGSSALFSLITIGFVMPPFTFEHRKDWLQFFYSDFRDIEVVPVKFKNRIEKTNGLSFSLAGSFAEANIVNGVHFSGIYNRSYKTNGISLSGIANYQYETNGVQLSGLSSVQYKNNGLQAGSLWSYNQYSNGVNIALLEARSNYVNGVQIGGYNNIKSLINGLQIGAYNTVSVVNGVQIGIYNSTSKLKGIQLGLWNCSEKRKLPIINWGF